VKPACQQVGRAGKAIRMGGRTISAISGRQLVHAELTEEIDQVLLGRFGAFAIDGRVNPDPEFRRSLVNLQAWRASLAKAAGQQKEIKAFLAGGPAVVEACHRALGGLKADDLAAARLAYLMGEVGRPESVPVLIGLLGEAEKIVLARMPRQVGERPYWAGWQYGSKGRESAVAAMVMRALWRLSGRRFWQRTADWSAWWKVVKGDFIVADERAGRTVTDARIDALATTLAGKDAPNARERMLCLGPRAVGRLVKLLADAKGDYRYHLLWLLDELDALEKASPKARLEYFIRRLPTEKQSDPIARQLRERALLKQNFADYCRTALAVNQRLFKDRKRPSMQGLAWGESERICKKVAGYKADDLKQAGPVLTQAINDPDKMVRSTGVYIVRALGRITHAAPDDLLEAMIELWRTEPNANLRYRVLRALGHYRTPAVEEAIVTGLSGDRQELVGDCVRVAQNVKWILDKDQPRIRRRFVELTRHKSPQIRQRTVYTLNARAPKLLADELDRLSKDASDVIRGNCGSTIVQLKDTKYLPILVRLMSDRVLRVRDYAFRAVGHEPYRQVVSPGDMLGVLSTQYQWYNAVVLIGERGGPEAVVTLLEGGRGHVKFTSHFAPILKKITDRQFEDHQALETWWWQFEIDSPAPAKIALDAKQLKALWNSLASNASLQAYRASVAMAGGGDRAVEFIAERVRPVSADVNRIPTLIKQFDSDKHAVRQNASAELFRIGRAAEAALRAAAKGKLDAESRARVSELLEACDRPYPVLPEAMRIARAIRVLELIATPQAVAVLKKLAKGTPKAHATDRAQAALKRIAKATTSPATRPSGGVATKTLPLSKTSSG